MPDLTEGKSCVYMFRGVGVESIAWTSEVFHDLQDHLMIYNMN